MKLTVELPVKYYVKRWLENRFGQAHPKYGVVVHLDRSSTIGKAFFLLVDNRDSHNDVHHAGYPSKVVIRPQDDIFLRDGRFLTPTNITRFNTFVEDQIKEHLHVFLDAMTSNYKDRQGLKTAQAIEVYLEKYGFDETNFPIETVKKSYQRHRSKNKR